MTASASSLSRLTAVAVAAALLAGCNAGSRLANVGAAPDFSRMETPATQEGYERVRMPMPAPQVATVQPASLWQPGSRAFFRDQRASDVGDILTVVIEIDDRASINNQSSRTRNSSEDAALPAFLGYEAALSDILPDEVNPAGLVDFGSSASSTGTGQIQRGETIDLSVAAVVVDQLPNNNLVIYGRQEVRVNFEVRDLEIAGVIRPEDITSANTITYDKIAEARIAYGGRGTISDVQQPRYGQQIYDIIFPF